MKLNRNWINEEFVDLSHISDKEYVETLTVFGQKVETYERMDAEIKNVVVGKVLEKEEASAQEIQAMIAHMTGHGGCGGCNCGSDCGSCSGGCGN